MVRRILLSGLLKIELPDHVVRLCDGGRLLFDGEAYGARDSRFGMLDEVDEIEDGVGDEAPAQTLRFVPPPEVASADLVRADYQGCRLRGWLAEVDAETGLILGTPDLEIDAIIDVPRLRFPSEGRVLEIDWVSVWQRLFSVMEGNVLNGAVHQRIHPGERGLDNANGVARTVAWGVAAQRGVALSGGAGGAGGGLQPNMVQA